MAKILLVDDEERSQYVQTYMKEFHSIEIEWVDSPQKAIEVIKLKGEFNLYLLDIMMKVGEGYNFQQEDIPNPHGILTGVHLLKFLRGEYGYVFNAIFCSARREEVVRDMNLTKSNSGDYQQYVKKPFDIEKLAKIIKKYIEDE